MQSIAPYFRKLACKQLDKYISASTFKSHDSDSIYVSIEGIIGVGKSTLSQNLEQKLSEKGERCILIKETVNLDWLNAFINKPKERASLFQIKRLCATIDAVNKMGIELSIRKEYGDRVSCIGDRLPLGNFAFALIHLIMANIDEEVFDLYGTALADGGPYIYPDIVLLIASPDIAIDRIKQRDRRGESAYTTDYLEKLDEATLFTLLYVWSSGVINVYPIKWDEFRDTEDVLEILKKPTSDISHIKNELLNMSYTDMKKKIYELAF